jgi:TonB family protein
MPDNKPFTENRQPAIRGLAFPAIFILQGLILAGAVAQTASPPICAAMCDSGVGPIVYQIGGDVTQPKVLYKVDPSYTEEARAASISGTVAIRIEVRPDGIAYNIKVTRGLESGLDQNAIDAIRQWRFQPGTKNGEPVTVEANVELTFRLLSSMPESNGNLDRIRVGQTKVEVSSIMGRPPQTKGRGHKETWFYEIGPSDARRVLSVEFVDGKSVRSRVLPDGQPSQASRAPRTPDVDWYFPVDFSPGATLSLKFSAIPNSRERNARTVIFRPWLSDGSPRETIRANILPGVTTEVRVDLSLDKLDKGWMQWTTDRGEPFAVSVALEVLDGNILRTYPQPPLDAIRPTQNARNSAFLSGAGNQLATVVMNVSNYPMDVGTCDTDDPDCAPSARRTIMPRQTVEFPIANPHGRLEVVKSSGGAYVCMVLDYRDLGSRTQTFDANSTIKYLPMK